MINTKLKCAIISEGFTVKSLAVESGVHEQTIRRAINGKSINIDTAKAIAKTLSKTLDELFSDEVEKC